MDNTSLKTTVTAVVGAIAMMVAHWGFNVGPEIQTGIISLVLIVLGYLMKDKDATGTKDKPRE